MNEFFVNDFPKKGVRFIDILQMLNKFKDKDKLDALTPKQPLTVILPEALGFIFYQNGHHHIFLRKNANKIPGNIVTFPYTNEYSEGFLSYREDYLNDAPNNAIIVDDVLATGNTALSIKNHFESSTPLRILGIISYVELVDLKGRELLESHNLFVRSLHKITSYK